MVNGNLRFCGSRKFAFFFYVFSMVFGREDFPVDVIEKRFRIKYRRQKIFNDNRLLRTQIETLRTHRLNV